MLLDEVKLTELYLPFESFEKNLTIGVGRNATLSEQVKITGGMQKDFFLLSQFIDFIFTNNKNERFRSK